MCGIIMNLVPDFPVSRRLRGKKCYPVCLFFQILTRADMVSCDQKNAGWYMRSVGKGTGIFR